MGSPLVPVTYTANSVTPLSVYAAMPCDSVGIENLSGVAITFQPDPNYSSNIVTIGPNGGEFLIAPPSASRTASEGITSAPKPRQYRYAASQLLGLFTSASGLANFRCYFID